MIDSRAKYVLPIMRHHSGPRWGRSLMVVSAVSAVLCLNLFSIANAGADAYWTNAIEMPGLATLNQSTAAPGPIVCTSSGNCVNGGTFTDGSTAQQAFVSQETNGVWGVPRKWPRRSTREGPRELSRSRVPRPEVAPRKAPIR